MPVHVNGLFIARVWVLDRDVVLFDQVAGRDARFGHLAGDGGLADWGGRRGAGTFGIVRSDVVVGGAGRGGAIVVAVVAFVIILVVTVCSLAIGHQEEQVRRGITHAFALRFWPLPALAALGALGEDLAAPLYASVRPSAAAFLRMVTMRLLIV